MYFGSPLLAVVMVVRLVCQRERGPISAGAMRPRRAASAAASIAMAVTG